MQPLSKFEHINATSIEEAENVLDEHGGEALIIAGGTDLLGLLKFEVLEKYPTTLVNLKTVDGLDYIKEEGGTLKIGALTKLSQIASDSTVIAKYSALAQAADRVASPQLRVMGTIGGNLCQECRCWYFRSNRNRFYCFRKGGTLCFAVIGDNRFNAILGGKVCFAVCPSDTAIALSALDAKIVTNKRTIEVSNFYNVLGNELGIGEIVTEIQVPEPASGSKQAFYKFSLRKAIDFAIASVATVIVGNGSVDDARVFLGGVAPTPYRANDAEDALKGNSISEAVAEDAAEAAVKDAVALSGNAYKIHVTKGIVKQAILG